MVLTRRGSAQDEGEVENSKGSTPSDSANCIDLTGENTENAAGNGEEVASPSGSAKSVKRTKSTSGKSSNNSGSHMPSSGKQPPLLKRRSTSGAVIPFDATDEEATSLCKQPGFLPSKAKLLPVLLQQADVLLNHLNALWALRLLGAPETLRERATFCSHYRLVGVCAPGGETLVETLITDDHGPDFNEFASAIHSEAIAFVKACGVDSRCPAHRKAKQRIEKLSSEDATQVVVKQGAFNAVRIAKSLDLCIRLARDDVVHKDEVFPAYEDAVRELIGYCELADLEQHVLQEQIGGEGCEEISEATLLPLTLHLKLSEDQPDAIPTFESTWRALHGDISGIIVKDNLPEEGLTACDMHAHMRPLLIHAAALFQRFPGRQQCDLNPRNMLLDWNGSMKKSDLGMYGTPRFMDAGTFGTLHPLQQFTGLGPTDFWPEWSGLMLDVFSLVVVMLRIFDERSFGPIIDEYAEQQRQQRDGTATEDDDSVFSNSELLATLKTLRSKSLAVLKQKIQDARCSRASDVEQMRLDQMYDLVSAVLSTTPSDFPTPDDIIQGTGVGAFLSCPRRCDHKTAKMKIVAQAKKNAERAGDSEMVRNLEQLASDLTASIAAAELALNDTKRARKNAKAADAKRDDILQELFANMDRAFEAAEKASALADEPESEETERLRKKSMATFGRARSRCQDLQAQLDLAIEESEMWRYKQDVFTARATSQLADIQRDLNGEVS